MANLSDAFNPYSAAAPTLVHVLRERAKQTPDHLAFCFLQNGEREGPRWSYSELDRQARAVAASLQNYKLAGERALLLFPPGLDFVIAFFGCLYAGVTAIPAYPPRVNHHMTRLRSIIEDSDVRAVLTVSGLLERLIRNAEEHDMSGMTWIGTDRIPEDTADMWEDPDLAVDNLAFLQYTSGSTGAPKGVMVTHANLMANLQLIRSAYELDESIRMMSWLPVFHDMGLIGMVLTAVYNGSTCYLMAPLDFIQRPRRWLQAISRYRIHFSAAPNFGYELCMQKIKEEELRDLDLSCWEIAVNGAEPVRGDTVRRFYETFAPYGFSPYTMSPAFGMAEATLLASWKEKKELPPLKTISKKSLKHGAAEDAEAGDNAIVEIVGCGKSSHGHQIIIVDPETLEPCADARVGEIWFKGPSVAIGYWNRPEQSAETFEAHTAAGDGPYLRTGDLGFMNDGELFVTGRSKDLLIFRGQNHYPQDLEFTVSSSHPALNHCTAAAFSLLEGSEEKLILVAEVDRNYSPAIDTCGASGGGDERTTDKGAGNSRKIPVTTEEILTAARRCVAESHDLQLAELVLVKKGAIPMTSSGKIQRRACKEAYLQHDLALWGDLAPNSNSKRTEEEVH